LFVCVYLTFLQHLHGLVVVWSQQNGLPPEDWNAQAYRYWNSNVLIWKSCSRFTQLESATDHPLLIDVAWVVLWMLHIYENRSLLYSSHIPGCLLFGLAAGARWVVLHVVKCMRSVREIHVCQRYKSLTGSPCCCLSL
jgi:hypothetical protein